RNSLKARRRSQRIATSVGRTLVESGYVVNKPELPEGQLRRLVDVSIEFTFRSSFMQLIRNRGFLVFSGPKLLDKAREMDGVPDLSALLKGKLQLLSKKSTSANVPELTSSEGGGGASEERASSLVDEGVGAEPSALSPRKKKKSKKLKRKATDAAPLENAASLDEASEGLEARKKKGGRKRPREGATSSIDQDEAPAGGREGAAEDLVETDPAEAKKSVDAEPRPSAVEATLVDVAMRGSVSPKTPSEKKGKVSTRGSGSGGEPAASEKSAPDSPARKGSRSEGSLVNRGRIEFPDRVQFSYDEKTPSIFNPLQCAKLTRQIRGGTKELPQIEDLYFKDGYTDAAFARKRSPEKENPKTGDILIQEGGTENVGPEDPVLVSDTSSESDQGEKTPSLRPNEEEVTSEVGKGNTSSIPSVGVDLLVPAQVEGPAVSSAEEPQDPPALSVLTGNGNDQDSAA
ncbi:hypothetical protein HID58_043153, partial [Brassica napus]